MEIKSLIETTMLLKSVFEMLRPLINLLPEGKEKLDAQQKLEQAERELQIAEITTAKALGHRICLNHWPSGIMLSKDNKRWECPSCHNVIEPVESNKHPWSDNKNF